MFIVGWKKKHPFLVLQPLSDQWENGGMFGTFRVIWLIYILFTSAIKHSIRRNSGIMKFSSFSHPLDQILWWPSIVVKGSSVTAALFASSSAPMKNGEGCCPHSRTPDPEILNKSGANLKSSGFLWSLSVVASGIILGTFLKNCLNMKVILDSLLYVYFSSGLIFLHDFQFIIVTL